MSIEDLERAQSEYGAGYPGGIVTYVLAYRLYEAGRTEESRAQLQVFLENYPGHELSEDAQALALAVDGLGAAPGLAIVGDTGPPPVDGGVESTDTPGPEGPLPEYQTMDIACLLPISTGRGAKYGREVQRGLQLALELYQPSTSNFRTNLVVLDSKGDPDLALELIEQAAARPNLLAVVGPLTSKEADVVAVKAEELGLPLISLSQDEDALKAGPHVFRVLLSHQAQAQAVARYAIQILGLRKPGHFAPRRFVRPQAEGLFPYRSGRFGRADR